MMHLGKHSRNPRGGFTLLELLLATMVGAIVLLVINATFFASLRLHDTTHEKIDEDRVLQRALAIVRKDLSGIMLPANPQATTSTLAGQLQTDAESLNSLDNTSQRVSPDIHTTSGRIDGWSVFAEVQTVAYYLSPSNDGRGTKSLVRSVTRNLLSAAMEVVSENQTLLEGVESASMSYYDGTAWTDVWDTTTSSTLPTAILFSLVMGSLDGARNDLAPIELIVPVVVKTPTSAQEEAAAAATQ